MRNRGLMPLAVVVAVIALALAAAAVSQGQGTSSDGEGAAEWTPPMTPDGQPDLQGNWTNYTATPFEVFDPSDTPGLYAGDPDGSARGTGPGFLNDTSDRKLTKGRSLVIDPANGRVPIMPWAEERRNYKLAHIQDHWENHTTWERCITRGVPGGIFPAGYGSGYQILQGRGYVAILYEMIHEARVIPIDARPHIGSSIRTWNGDSRGRWEGNTLIVDITNYNNKGSVATNVATQRVRAIPQSEDLHVVERFTRVDENTINYEATIEDPKVFTRPWKISMLLYRRKEPRTQLLEYECYSYAYDEKGLLPNPLPPGEN
jgi:hypothetical protein